MTASFQGAGWRRTAVAAALAAAGSASAETPQDRYWGNLEFFFPTITSTARLDFPNTGIKGTEIRLEDELGLDDRKGTPYLLLGMRLGDNWRLEFEYYQLKRDATHTISRDIQWGDVNYPASATLQSRFDSSIYRLTGGYSFYRTQQAEVGGAFGLHVTDFTVALAGQGNGAAGLSFRNEARDALVPLPTIGVYGSWVFAPQWVLRGRVDYLSLNYEQYDGRLVNVMAGVDWRFSKNWGVGGGYRYVDYTVGSTRDRFQGEITYSFKGPTLYLTAGF